MGQISRFHCSEPDDITPPSILWRKVNWKSIEKDIKDIAQRDGGWEEIVGLVKKLPRARNGGARKCDGWWTVEIERMSKEVRLLRRRRHKNGDEGWKLARKIFRNTILNEWCAFIKERLSQANDQQIFKMVRNLQEHRTIPFLTNSQGKRISSHQVMSQTIADQLKLTASPERHSHKTVDITVDSNDVQLGLMTSSRNTAAGIDGVGYPLLRLWFKTNSDHRTRMINGLIKNGYPTWSEAITVLIAKAGKPTYTVAKSWRMIHLLPTLAKVVDRIILNRQE